MQKTLPLHASTRAGYPEARLGALGSQTATGLPTGMTVLTGSYRVKLVLALDFGLSGTSWRCQMELTSHASTRCSSPQTCQVVCLRDMCVDAARAKDACMYPQAAQ